MSAFAVGPVDVCMLKPSDFGILADQMNDVERIWSALMWEHDAYGALELLPKELEKAGWVIDGKSVYTYLGADEADKSVLIRLRTQRELSWVKLTIEHNPTPVEER
jgi:hypothetical protein